MANLSNPSNIVCRTVRAGETCFDPNCRFTHTVATCEICNLVFVSLHAYEGHTTGKKHRNNATGRTATVHHCPLCQRDIHISGGMTTWKLHLQSNRHLATARRLRVSPDVEPETAKSDVAGHQFCDVCDTHVANNLWTNHTQTRVHQSKLLFSQYRNALGEAEKDKHGVIINGTFDFDIVDPAEAANGITTKGWIQTNIPSTQIMLVGCTLASSRGGKTRPSPFEITIQGSSRLLTSRRMIYFAIVARQNFLGRFNDRLDFIFQDENNFCFMISRPLCIIVGDKADHHLFKPKLPYEPRTPTFRQPETKIVAGIVPPSIDAIPYISVLPKYPIPKQLLSILSSGNVAQIMGKVQQAYLPSGFDSETYARYFKCLLWLEEFRMDQDLERYDIESARLDPHGQYYYLQVPGLAEKRPGVLVGDRILVQRPELTNGHWFEGRVHVVRKEEVGLRFHPSFRANRQFRVRFKLNRFPMRRQHLALESTFIEDRVLFPGIEHLSHGEYGFLPAGLAEMTYFNPLIGGNPAQSQAVVSIMSSPAGSIPFVIFGPPGTGKTVTIVEAIHQLLSKDPNTRILACAPSNSAADLIASRLTDLASYELFRAYASSRSKDEVPSELHKYVYRNRDGHFSVPSMNKLSAFRVIVTTCVSSSMLLGVGMRPGHFSHIFVDEAGQATEPEVMIAIKTMADDTTNIVLSGDPKQLGPIIRSGVARKLGLEKSYIERLMERDVYDDDLGYGTCVVKLVKNFRSHRSILHYPNERFYKGTLECCADPKVVNAYLQSSHVARYDFPIVFYSLAGKDERDSSSPSFFNIDEVTQVKNVIESLRSDRNVRISDADIGVITPYHAQCLKIRTKLSTFAEGVKVATVEEFQGCERKVIIISTVRSSQEFLEYDLKHTLGFVASPRRFNVAVTRAKALLIIIGNPSVLSLDPMWRSFLNYIYKSGGWKGPVPAWDTTVPVDETGGFDRQYREAAKADMEDFTKAMDGLSLGLVDDDGDVDRPWNDWE